MRGLAGSVLLSLMLASPAWAQMNYVVTQTTQPYVPLSGATVATLTNDGTFTVNDEGYALIPLGFTFPYYGQNYTEVGVNTNGRLVFGSANNDCNYSTGSFLCYSGGTPPDTSIPNNNISPWFGDLKANTGGQIRYFKPSPSDMVIEYWDFNRYSGSASFSFQVRLNASGLFQVHYGPISGTFTGGNGFEDATGSQGGVFMACGGSCNETNWPVNALFTVGQPVAADLYVDQVVISNITPTGSDLSITLAPTLRNFGQTAASNFHWKAYLSEDRYLDATDQPFFTSSTPVSIGPTTTVTVSGTGVATNVAQGQYYVLVEVDPDPNPACISNCGVVTEFSETNNVGVTADYFTFGIDLVATSISGPAVVRPNDQVSVQVSWFNQGTDAPATPGNLVKYDIVLSRDLNIDSYDQVVQSFEKVVQGGSSFNETLTFTFPETLSGGQVYWALRLDPGSPTKPGGEVAEANETNNTVLATTISTAHQADLVPLAVDLVDPVTLQPVRKGVLGEKARMRVEVKNEGGVDSKAHHIGVVLSSDAYPNLSFDLLVHDEPVSGLAAGQTVQHAFEFDLPLVDKLGNPLKGGNYYLFAYVDSFSEQAELEDSNNTRYMGATLAEPVLLLDPAPDYVVTHLQIPASAAVGEAIPVARTLRNVGTKDGAGPITYRFVASANDIITPDDVPLAIIGPNGQLLDSGTVTLGRGEDDSATEFVQFPAIMVPGAWYVGVIVDAAGTEPELDEANNAFASLSTVQVAPSTMWITNQQLPDAVVNQPYNLKLSVAGARGDVTWASDDGLPDGLSLTPDGVLIGTPTELGVFTFTAFATEGTRAAASKLVVRVMPVSGELMITSLNLPPVVASPSVNFAANLSAAGGTMPYTWSILSGSLPNGIRLTENGELQGASRGTMVGEYPVVFRVQDALGNLAEANIKVKVVEAGTLVIQTLMIPETMVNASYGVGLNAEMVGGGQLATPLTWSLAAGALPEGLAITTESESIGVITGKALTAGTYTASIQVMDAKGRMDVAEFILRVHPGRLKLQAVNPPAVVHPGDAVGFQITTGSTNSIYRIYSGKLPPGLEMDQAGIISGTVDMENSVGTWNFVVEAKETTAGTSLGAFSLEVTPSPVAAGCSTASGSSGSMWLALLAPVFVFFSRRRKAALAFAAAAAAVVLPSAALAQQQYQIVTQPSAFVPLNCGTSLNVSGSTSVTVNIPFKFSFFGTEYPSVGVSANGYVVFPSGNSLGGGNPTSIPTTSTSYPDAFAAAWWDTWSKGTGSVVKACTIGAAPSRTFIVEWKDMCNSTTSSGCTNTNRGSFQIQLHEGSNKIRFHYGTSTSPPSSASIGIQGTRGVGMSPFTCGGSCGVNQWISNSFIDFAPPADLLVAAVSADDTGYAGVPMPVSALLRNQGGLKATGVYTKFYLSRDAVLDATDIVLGTTQNAPPMNEVDLMQDKLVSTTLLIPEGTAPSAAGTNYFLIAKVDPDNLVTQETADKKANNTSAPMIFKVGPPTPNLNITNVKTGGITGANSGDTLNLTATLRNQGNADTTAPVQITWFLSDNSVVTIDDVVLATTSANALAKGATTPISATSMPIPSNLPAGKYWVGACADFDPSANPSSTLTEINEVDNCATGASFVLSTGALAILTSQTDLPNPTQNAAYGVVIEATGGNGTYAWSHEGALPPGMTLTQQGPHGYLSGTPSGTGKFDFTAKVASDGATATKPLSLTVTAHNLPLTIVDQVLPAAEFGRSYRVPLVAVGGKAPYIWSIQKDSRLPEGLGMSNEGMIEGRATDPRTLPVIFTVEVRDSEGTQAAKQLQIQVTKPSSLQIATSELATATLGRAYRQELIAIGGSGSYNWGERPIKVQRLAETATEVPGPEMAEFPQGFGLSIKPEAGKWILSGEPAMAGLYAVTFRVTDSSGAEDITTLPLHVTYRDPLAIVTTALPDAFVGLPYNVKLTHNMDPAKVSVVWTLPCVQQAKSSGGNFIYECLQTDAAQNLPGGLVLEPTGAITGAAAVEPGTFSFLVQVTDSEGRQDVRGLSIKVRPAPPEYATGCSGTGVAPFALALLSLVGLARRRRQ